MKQTTRSITKVTRPGPRGVYHRKRLFSRLDRAFGRPIVWVSAPPGSGKTTLLADYLSESKSDGLWYCLDGSDSDAATFFHYLTLAAKKAAKRRKISLPEFSPLHIPGLKAFTRRFFGKLTETLPPPFCIVLDNYQDLPHDSPVHDIVAEAVGALPEGVVIAILSRAGPPPPFSGLMAEGLMDMVGPGELCLTEEETRGIIRLKAGVEWKEDDKEFADLFAGLKGWLGGLVLILEGLSRRGLGGLEPISLKDLSHDLVFEYFAGEIFNGLGMETRDFLLKTSILPEMTPAMAERLTHNKGAERILSRLSRDNYFTERRLQPGTIYSYHPLFREFLMKRARKVFSSRRLAMLRRIGGALLEEAGEDEAAAVLYAEGGAWDGLSGLVMRLAPRHLGEGRFVSLTRILATFPRARLNKNPWLLYWLGVASSQLNPAEAKHHFAKAFEAFDEARDSTGIFLSWAGVVRAICFEFRDFRRFDRWIDLLEDLTKRYPSFPSDDVETQVTASIFLALLFRKPAHPRMKYWAGRARVLVEKTDDENLRAHIFMHLCFYYQFTGELQKGRMLGERLIDMKGLRGAAPLTHLVAATVMANYHYAFGEYRACVDDVLEGLALAESSGVHIMDYMILGQGASAALAEGDTLDAASYLKKMSPVLDGGTAFDMSFYYFLMAWKSLVEGDPSRARRYGWMAKDLSVAVGSPYPEVLSSGVLTLALFECGERANAALELAKMKATARNNGFAFFRYLCLMIEAHMALEAGEEKKARTTLGKFFSIGREFGFLKHHLFIPRVMTGLCKKALEEGIETGHVKRLICECSFVPDPPPVEMDEWPWPIRIFTFGRFSILRRGKAVRFHGKALKKPLEMLKVLIALGGRDITEARLADILWPDAEGPSSHRTFTITLHRLRTLLDCHKAVTLSDGRVSLAPACCHVDTWAFEREVRWAERALGGDARKEARKLFARAVGMYHGPFLAGDMDTQWSINTRERLRSKFLRCASELGCLLEETGEYEKAVEAYKKAIEVDSLVEGLYYNLMLCYRAMGKRSEALAQYRRLEKVLDTELGIRPTPATEALYRGLLGKKS